MSADYDRLPIAALRELAGGGFMRAPDAAAQYRLCLRYANGDGVECDAREAARWCRLAAEQGNADAQANLGWMHATGAGVPRDEHEALRWYRLAADQGDANAEVNLGLMAANGQGQPRDDDEAVRWYRRAADRGDASALFNLGFMYATGRGVTKNEHEAARLCRLAADRGSAMAQNNLGRMYETGWGVFKDEAQAVHWYRRAADAGNVDAQYNLGRMCAAGHGVAKDEKQAAHWFHAAASHGHDRAQYRLGLMHAHDTGVRHDDAEAVRWYQRAAEQGNPAAQCALGSAYQNGRGTPVDYGAALYWYLRATEKGCAAAFNDLGWLYEHGLGVDSDLAEAERLYRTAADKGSVEAARRLASLRTRRAKAAAAGAHGAPTTFVPGLGSSHPEPQAVPAAPPPNPVAAYLEEAFAGFVGLGSVRAEVARQASYVQIQKLRAAQGLPALASTSRHLVFLGNPGTGKTSIARIIASLYHRLGLLPSDKLVETDRAGLVAPYVGQTALKTKEVVESALGGVLFIDEAYTLARGGERDFGKEAIDTLLKMMEDHRDELAVIVAGYESEMQAFIDGYPGMASRFNRYIRFPNYSPNELVTIFGRMCRDQSYLADNIVNYGLHVVFAREIKAQRQRFGNARYVRNLFERVVEAQAHRLVTSGKTSSADLQTLIPADMESALGETLPTPESAADGYRAVMQRLDGLIGLSVVKEQVHRLADFVRMQRARADAGFKVAEGFSQHLVFSGNPGTGKTTIARIIADLYCALGVLPSNHLVEVDRSGLVAGYVGQSAIKTREVIEQAMGGVLFIDEAYALAGATSHEADFGHEVVDTLVKAMEDYRDQFVVIVAGYRDEMARFVDSNPGLRSRFSRYITFPDYAPAELVEIFRSLCARNEYELDANAQAHLTSALAALAGNGRTDGNGRLVRNLFEHCVEIQSQRVSRLDSVRPEDLKRIAESDVAAALVEVASDAQPSGEDDAAQ